MSHLPCARLSCCSLVLISLMLFTFISAAHAQQEIAPTKAPFDFDGDNKTDLCVYRPSDGTWYIFQSQTQSYHFEPFGVKSDKLVPGDYDGDGKWDIAVWLSVYRVEQMS